MAPFKIVGMKDTFKKVILAYFTTNAPFDAIS
jgi:hypothetical protein